jgi:hypothetical protein
MKELSQEHTHLFSGEARRHGRYRVHQLFPGGGILRDKDVQKLAVERLKRECSEIRQGLNLVKLPSYSREEVLLFCRDWVLRSEDITKTPAGTVQSVG